MSHASLSTQHAPLPGKLTGGRKWTVWLTLALVLAAESVQGANLPGEYELKAAVVAKLLSFIDRPTNAPALTPTTRIIGVFGQDPFGSSLQDLSRRRAAGVPSFQVRACTTVADARKCHVLFVSGSEKGRLNDLLAALRGDAVLTVSDLEGFASGGGMVRLATANHRVTLQINLAVLRESGLRVDPYLLQLAEVIDSLGKQKVK